VKLRLLTCLMFCFSSAYGEENSSNDFRTLPLPSAASSQLQAAIQDFSPPDRSVFPTSDAEWLVKIEQAGERSAPGISIMLEQTPVDVVQDRLAGVKIHRVTPDQVSPENEKRLFLYAHGGAYVYGGGDAGITEAILIANRIGIPVLSVDYRMPPNYPFPAAIDDMVSVYKALLKSRSAKSIIIGGTSAGGGLALAAVHQYQKLNLPIPAAIYAGTPWADLTKTGDTLFTNEGLDRSLVTYDGFLAAAARLYAGKYDMKNPLLSPVYGDFSDFPPTILVSGTRDLFLSDVVRTHRKLREADVIADLHVYEGMSHAGYIRSSDTPESKNMYSELGAFIDKYMD